MTGAREAFGPERWDRAVQDPKAAQEIIAWLEADGFQLRPLLVPAHRNGATDRQLQDALRRLLSVHGAMHRIVPAQIAAARLGDLVGTGSEILWRVRRCGWALDAEVMLRGEDAEALRIAASWGRKELGRPEDPLLAPRERWGPWDARSIRAFALKKNGEATSEEA